MIIVLILFFIFGLHHHFRMEGRGPWWPFLFNCTERIACATKISHPLHTNYVRVHMQTMIIIFILFFILRLASPLLCATQRRARCC